MFDEVFGEVTFDYNGYVTNKEMVFLGERQNIELRIDVDEDEEGKGAYGPDDPDEFKEWWPDIDSEEELAKKIHMDSIIVPSDYIMEIKGKNPVYVFFNRDWGGEDLEDNGIAVLIEDGEVSEVGYKYIAY